MTMVLKSFSVTLSVLGRAANATYAPGITDPKPVLQVTLDGASLEEVQGLLALLARAKASDAQTALLESRKDELAGLAKSVEAGLPKASAPTPVPNTNMVKTDGAVAVATSVVPTSVRNGAPPKPEKKIQIVVDGAADAKPAKVEEKVKATAQAAAKAAPPAAAAAPSQDELQEDDDDDALDALDAAIEGGAEAPEDELEDVLLKAGKPSVIFRHLFVGKAMSLEDGTQFLIRNRARLPFFKDLKEVDITTRAKNAHAAVAPAGASA